MCIHVACVCLRSVCGRYLIVQMWRRCASVNVWSFTHEGMHRAPVCVRMVRVYIHPCFVKSKRFVVCVHCICVCVLVDGYAYTCRWVAACVQRSSRVL